SQICFSHRRGTLPVLVTNVISKLHPKRATTEPRDECANTKKRRPMFSRRHGEHASARRCYSDRAQSSVASCDGAAASSCCAQCTSADNGRNGYWQGTRSQSHPLLLSPA